MEENHMLDFVKALSDAERLRIIGMLTQHPATNKEIASELGIPFKDVYSHLAFLAYTGVVREKNGVYELDSDALESLSRRQFAGKPRESYTPAPDLDAEKRKVLKTCLNPDGSIKQIPQQPARLRVILDYILAAFTPRGVGRRMAGRCCIRTSLPKRPATCGCCRWPFDLRHSGRPDLVEGREPQGHPEPGRGMAGDPKPLPFLNATSMRGLARSHPTGTGSRTSPTNRGASRSTCGRFRVRAGSGKSRRRAGKPRGGGPTARSCITSLLTAA